jgi:hypothetical protein
MLARFFKQVCEQMCSVVEVRYLVIVINPRPEPESFATVLMLWFTVIT